MKTFLYSFLLFLSSLLTVQAQEKIYNQSDLHEPFAGATYFNNQVHLGLININLDPYQYKSNVLIFDDDGNLTQDWIADSSWFSGLGFLGTNESEDKLITMTDKKNQNGVFTDVSVHIYDSSYQELEEVNLLENHGFIFPYDIMLRSDTLILVGTYISDTSQSIFPAIRAYKGNQLIKSYNFKYSTAYIYSSIAFKNNQYFIGAYYGEDELFTILNKDLSIDSIYYLNNYTPPIDFGINFNDIIIPENSSSIYAIGTVNHATLMKFDTNFNITNEYTFPPSSGEYFFFPFRKFSSYQSLDSIFIVTYERILAFSQWDNLPGEENIHNFLDVSLIDTAGNIHWTTTIDNNCYYLPFHIVATNDGGALIFSSKYDTAYKKEPHYLMSVIKIDNKGNYISEKEYPLQQSKLLSLYPNPAQNTLNIKLPTQRSMQTYRIYNTAGATVQEANVSAKTTSIDISKLNKGFYFIEIIDDKGEVYTSRFQKE